MSNEAALAKLDDIAKEGCAITRSLQASFSSAIQLARVVRSIKEVLTIQVVKEEIMPLMGCDFGWRTDRDAGDKAPYSIEQIRDVWVNAALVGAVPINNEVNMISGRMYLCKNHFKRKLREFPGLTDLVFMPGKVSMLPSGALVEFTVTWKLEGKPGKMERTKDSAIPVRLNNGMGADGALGKAERKIRAALYSHLTGSIFTDEDDDADEVSDETPAKLSTQRVPQQLAEPVIQTHAQTKAVTERIKEKAREKGVTVTKSSEDDVAPWEGGDETGQASTQAEAPSQTQSQPQTQAQGASTTAAPEKVVGYVKLSGDTGFKKTTKAATEPAESAPQKSAEPQKTEKPENQGKPEPAADSSGELLSAKIMITAIKAKDKAKNPPFRIVDQNATEYFTDDVNVALKCKEYLTDKVPVEVTYFVAEDKRWMIHEISPADFGTGEPGPEKGDAADM